MSMRGYVFTFNLSRMSANFEERRESLVREPTQSEPDSKADWRSFSNVFDNGSQPQQPELRIILDFAGWRTRKVDAAAETSPSRGEPFFHPFLPASLQYLDVLPRGGRPPFDLSIEQPISTIFERRTLCRHHRCKAPLGGLRFGNGGSEILGICA